MHQNAREGNSEKKRKVRLKETEKSEMHRVGGRGGGEGEGTRDCGTDKDKTSSE